MITYVRLQHFRSYTDGSFEFDPRVNIVVGPNASGKTTLLESIIVALSGKSFKASDTELLQDGAEWSRVDVGMADDIVRVCKLVIHPQKVDKTFEVSDRVYKRLPVHQTFPVVLFEPNHLLLFHGSPELRRNFLDDLVEQLQPGYDAVRRQYKRVLAQRNALLKQMTTPRQDQLFVWNVRLSELAGKIVSERLHIIERLNNEVNEVYTQISGEDAEISFSYDTMIPTAHYESAILKKLEASVRQDMQRGFTGVGPHREDVLVFIRGREVSETASRGEVRTLVLACKVLEAKLVEGARGVRPLLLFDDVFSELDGRRRQALVSFLKPYQTLITTTDADVVVQHFSKNSNILAL